MSKARERLQKLQTILFSHRKQGGAQFAKIYEIHSYLVGISPEVVIFSNGFLSLLLFEVKKLKPEGHYVIVKGLTWFDEAKIHIQIFARGNLYTNLGFYNIAFVLCQGLKSGVC